MEEEIKELMSLGVSYKDISLVVGLPPSVVKKISLGYPMQKPRNIDDIARERTDNLSKKPLCSNNSLRKKIIEERRGGKTFKKISEELGISRVRVIQIHYDHDIFINTNTAINHWKKKAEARGCYLHEYEERIRDPWYNHYVKMMDRETINLKILEERRDEEFLSEI